MSLWHLFNYLNVFSHVLIIFCDSPVEQQEQSICRQTGMLDADMWFLLPPGTAMTIVCSVAVCVVVALGAVAVYIIYQKNK